MGTAIRSAIPYIKIVRFDHWFKNVFVLPGVALVLYLDPTLIQANILFNLVLALLSTGLVASSNYVINEILDAPYDRLHPVKKNRPIPSGMVNIKYALVEWVFLGCCGLGLALLLGRPFFSMAALLLLMGLLYNMPPIRLKDKPYLDVLSEAANNPIRLSLGWYATGADLVIPLSLLLAYWMLGAFFMAVKRFAEFRRIDSSQTAAAYRKSFKHYNEQRLIVGIIYYAVAFGLFCGIFLIRYRMELLLCIPFLAGFIAWYIHLGFLEDSPTQYPETLYRQKGFMLYTLFLLLFTISMFFIPIPILQDLFEPTQRILQ
jgi:decaprenyl-phosphate phosphoribosyltransferase